MICPICKCGHTRSGFASVTLERDNTTLVVQQVSALICDNCGEEFIEESAAAQLLNRAESAVHAGVQIELRQYAAA